MDGTASGRNGQTPTDANVRPAPPTSNGERHLHGRLRVWIDQDLCTGDGICTDHAPDVFTILEDGIAYCQENGRTLNDPGGAAQLAVVPAARETDVIDAAADCPGECIFIEFEELAELDQ